MARISNATDANQMDAETRMRDPSGHMIGDASNMARPSQQHIDFVCECMELLVLIGLVNAWNRWFRSFSLNDSQRVAYHDRG